MRTPFESPSVATEPAIADLAGITPRRYATADQFLDEQWCTGATPHDLGGVGSGQAGRKGVDHLLGLGWAEPLQPE